MLNWMNSRCFLKKSCHVVQSWAFFYRIIGLIKHSDGLLKIVINSILAIILFSEVLIKMHEKRSTYSVEIAGVHRELPLFEVKPGLRIAILNILGDTELVQACAISLAEKLKSVQYDVLVTAESKSIPLAHALSVTTGKPYVILRKSYKPYMGNALQAETLSITTGQPQTLFLDEKDRQLMEGKQVVILDDVISTGSTLQGMRLLMGKADARIIAEAAIFTEGERAKWSDVISLGHLPVFSD